MQFVRGQSQMIAVKVFVAAALTAGSLLAVPPAHADYGPGDPPCPATGCQPPPKATPPPVRGVLGCVRGVCIPNPRPPWQRH
ncbi:hypothetical protein [Mycobacterium paragordonae]|uniref:Secreted protein n=1 Tax=Mycobacterium paragordonae TaxID=1389713 RepID=A0ABQ1BZ34_9MYCO|nr:hypothetical protein [Mycobacterium paragordonae]GFG77214.1 hypothetical protein MPRG_04900 [Mycobacterium paragordonae]